MCCLWGCHGTPCYAEKARYWANNIGISWSGQGLGPEWSGQIVRFDGLLNPFNYLINVAKINFSRISSPRHMTPSHSPLHIR